MYKLKKYTCYAHFLHRLLRPLMEVWQKTAQRVDSLGSYFYIIMRTKIKNIVLGAGQLTSYRYSV